MEISLSASNSKEADSNEGGPNRPFALFENPNCSVGMPKKLVSSCSLLLESTYNQIA